MKKVVFVSHIYEEKEIAILVKEFIETAFLGLIDVFISSDEHSISLGQKWLNNITDSLKTCSIEIILCSPKSIIRPWINFEAGSGWIRDIPVIPLCHSGLEPSKLPLPLNLLQAAKANDINNMKLLLPVLANSIESKIPTYDFTDFIIKVLEFEKVNTFWVDCNKAFEKIHEINNQIISVLKSGRDIDIGLSEYHIREFKSLHSFLIENELLEFKQTGGGVMGPMGSTYNCCITQLRNMKNVLHDTRFNIK